MIGAQSVVAPGATIQVVSQGYKFLEGPTPDPKGNVYFSDIPNKIIHICSTEGVVTEYMKVPGCNGLKFDKKGNLWVCGNSEARSIYYITPDKTVVPVITNYKGKKLNGPNDLWIAPKGGVYFTDPAYGYNRTDLELSHENVYYIGSGKKTAVLMDSTFDKPNGIAGLLNGKVLYVADHKGGKTFRYTIGKKGLLTNKTLFCETGSDGMAIDEHGNIYLSMKGIQVFSPEGKKLETIEVPANPTNICFGGADGKTLYITTPSTLYSIKMQVKGLGR